MDTTVRRGVARTGARLAVAAILAVTASVGALPILAATNSDFPSSVPSNTATATTLRR